MKSIDELLYGVVFLGGVFPFLGLFLFLLLCLLNLGLEFLDRLQSHGRFLVFHFVNVVLYLELCFDKLVYGVIVFALTDFVYNFFEFLFFVLYGLLHYLCVFFRQVVFQLVDVFADRGDFLLNFFLDLDQALLLNNFNFLLKILRRLRLLG